MLSTLLKIAAVTAAFASLLAPALMPAAAQDDEGEVAITLERTPCFGGCPVYTVTIYTDGRVVFEGERFTSAQGTQTAIIDPEMVEQLVAGFEQAGYFDWQDAYTEMTISDLPTVITSVTRDGETKQITRYAGDSSAPLALPYLETWIDLAASTDQWTGVSSWDANTSLMDGTAPVMTLQRTPCFGMCPVYGLKVFADGTVIYLGLRYVEQPGVRTTTVEPSQVESLAMQADLSGYFGWNDEYTRQLVTDHPTAISSLTWNDQHKQITRYDGDPDAPIGLVRFEEAIDRLANTSQWIGGAE
ncbi:MAG: (2Fe-2S) ferredoxin domain-containing protein [Anaerolineae bacterium]|nr:(2Fe-2S) ferredoxin domain-containing protein [Anaerolineae bacterium]